MRIPKYLSPTSLGKFEKDPEQFYIEYLSDIKRPRDPQTPAMAVGAAFDAYVKAYLAEAVFGVAGAAAKNLDFVQVFESQVEPHNRTISLEDGRYCFQHYKEFGALSALLAEMAKSKIEPQLDLKINTTISSEYGDVPLHGRPDLHFITRAGVRVILDWKVNGFYSKKLPSPAPGYMRCWRPNCSGNYETHKNFMPAMMPPGSTRAEGLEINQFYTLDTVKTEWADQLATYSWVLDGTVCIDCPTVYWIEQLLLHRLFPGRIVQHRCGIQTTYQWLLLRRYNALWKLIQAGFPVLSMEKKAELDSYDPAWEAMLRAPTDRER